MDEKAVDNATLKNLNLQMDSNENESTANVLQENVNATRLSS